MELTQEQIEKAKNIGLQKAQVKFGFVASDLWSMVRQLKYNAKLSDKDVSNYASLIRQFIDEVNAILYPLIQVDPELYREGVAKAAQTLDDAKYDMATNTVTVSKSSTREDAPASEEDTSLYDRPD